MHSDEEFTDKEFDLLHSLRLFKNSNGFKRSQIDRKLIELIRVIRMDEGNDKAIPLKGTGEREP